MKVKTKLLLCVTGLLSLIFGIGGSMIISISFNSSLESEKNTALQSFRMIRNTLTIANSISRQTDYDDIIDVLNQLSNDGKSIFAALYLFDEKSKIIFKSNNRILSTDISESDVKDRYSYVKLITMGDSSYFKIYELISVNGAKLCLMALYDTTEIYSLRENQSLIYRRVLIVMTLVAAVGSWIIAALLTRSLKSLSKTANEIAMGSLSSRVKIHSGDEVERLADDFNNMASRLESTIGELTDTLRKQEEFMGSFAHELKTPMTSIIGYADLLRSKSLSGDEREEAAQYIFSEGKRLESLSFKLLDLIMLNRQSFTLKKADPSAIIDETVNSLKDEYAKAGVILTARCDDGCLMLETDLFKSLVINLIDNAYKSIESEGKIDVSLELKGEEALLKVADTGKGIPQEEIEKITEAFYRVDKSRSRSRGGVGLGLALCSEIVRLHNGCMTFESRLGEGTTVTVILRGEGNV